ncbi:hypothetical protein IFM89_033083 [Coptis chinensis]|uniref:Uncharacterized protein n=1 Tax=Coptis chinensis TaxID=261450 RepID=A0A835II66_9MAGN|nr:hypothetical protein IFM89_033083 [Coptis chinensis]
MCLLAASKLPCDMSCTPSLSLNNFGSSDDFTDEGTDIHKGSGFCSFFQELQAEVFNIVSHPECNGAAENCNMFVPFMIGSDTNASATRFQNFKLTMQNIQCEPGSYHGMDSTARVAATF